MISHGLDHSFIEFSRSSNCACAQVEAVAIDGVSTGGVTLL